MNIYQDDLLRMEAEAELHRADSNILSSIAGLDSSLWVLEQRRCEHGTDFLAGLDELYENSIDPNIFFEPSFFLAGYERLGKVPKFMMIVWEELGGEKVARLAFPVAKENVGLPPRAVWRVASNQFAPLSTPLLHSENHEGTVGKFVELLKANNRMKPDLLLFESLDCESNFYKNISRLPCFVDDDMTFSRTSRSVLRQFNGVEEFEKYSIKAKRRRELRRQQKRLEELGHLEYECVDEPMDVLVRFEEFLLLESRGWKGKRGSSLNDIRQTAAFARQAISNIANEGACSVYSLRLDGKPLASLIMLRTKSRYYPWKITYDEAYNSYAPGMLLFWHASRVLVGQESFEAADSLAAPGNKLTHAIWKDDMELTNALLMMGKADMSSVLKVRHAMERKEMLKQKIKRLIGRK